MTRASRVRSTLAVAALAGAAACASGTNTAATPELAVVISLDSARLIGDVGRLAHDSLRGRRSGTPENAQARDWFVARFQELGLRQISAPEMQGYLHAFTATSRSGGAPVPAANVVGMVSGTANIGEYIVITAHYDHVGVGRPVNGDSIYNGADDNASGTAALLALARHFTAHPPAHSIIFAALDAEEMGLQGAHAFVNAPPVPLASIVLNVNMDMVSHSDSNELYAAGAAHYPSLAAPLRRVAERAPVGLLFGHDRPVPSAADDWTNQSDHAAFHARGIPFVYFGVEDHPDYHQPSDEVESITPAFFVKAVRTIIDAVMELDGEL